MKGVSTETVSQLLSHFTTKTAGSCFCRMRQDTATGEAHHVWHMSKSYPDTKPPKLNPEGGSLATQESAGVVDNYIKCPLFNP